MDKIFITLKRSLIRRPLKQRLIVQSLGLTSKVNSIAHVTVTKATLAKLRQVAHLIKIEQN